MDLEHACLHPCNIHTCTKPRRGGVFMHGPWFAPCFLSRSRPVGRGVHSKGNGHVSSRTRSRASRCSRHKRTMKACFGTSQRAPKTWRKSRGSETSHRRCAGRTKTQVRAVSDTEKRVSEFDRVSILSEALPYLQKFAGKTVVVKYGGAAMKDPTLKAGVISDVVLLALVGLRVVLVHGGGPEINTWLSRVGIEPNFKNGLRVTDGATMEVVEMVLVGKVNKSIVSLINKAGGKAVGLCGKDGKLIRARQVTKPDIGFVGEVSSVDASILDNLAGSGCIPVIASVAEDQEGQSLNINADTAAGEIAAALAAEKLILMTDVPGVLLDKDDISTLQRSLAISDTRRMVADGIIAGGMIPKVECCVRSIAQGVNAAHIIDGRQKHSLLQEILTDEGVGTMITG